MDEQKHPGGRPTDYREDICEKVDVYLSMCGREQTALPTIEGFAVYLDVARSTVYLWAKEHKEFSDTLEKISTYQKIQLINDGIYGGKEVNATIVKLMLQNNHGMKERTDTTTNDKELPTPIYNGKSTNSTE